MNRHACVCLRVCMNACKDSSNVAKRSRSKYQLAAARFSTNTVILWKR